MRSIMKLLLFYFLTLAGITYCVEEPPVTKITVKEDEDVILPCSLDSANIQSDIFDWKKDDQKEVFMYAQGNHYNNGRGGQDPQFKGRVFHFEDQLQSGNASIVIRNTKVTDSGRYSCIFPHHQTTTRSMIELIVGSNKPAPKPGITHHQANEGVLLQCEVRGASPKPKVVWKDRAGKILPAEEPEVTENKGSHNINLKTTVTKTDHYRCVSTQEEINHEVHSETYVSVYVTKMGVKEDEDVILPCSFGSTNIQSQVFDWKKEAENNKDDQKEVFLYAQGTHYNNGRSGQDPQFKGRVFHFEDQLQSGNASIFINKTKVTDSGRYSCIFPHHQPKTRSIIELIVDYILKDRTKENKPGAAPKPGITHQAKERVLLKCVVEGASPKPKVVWKDGAGNIVPAEESDKYENEGRYNIILKTTVTKTDHYRCVSTQEELSHEVYSEIYVLVAVIVKEDEDVILPCSLDSTNIQSDTFDWKKDDQEKVFMYAQGTHSNNGRSGQDPQFKGRVFHFEDQLQSGNASIVIRNTKVTDSGRYTCIFPFPLPERTRSIIELIVVDGILKDRTKENLPGAAPKPGITHHQTNEGVLLQCVVESASPKPKVVWKDGAGNILPAEEPEVKKYKDLYNIILKTNVTKTNNYRCVSTQEEINHEVYTEIDVSVHGSNTGPIIGGVVGVLIFVVVAVVAVLYTKRKYHDSASGPNSQQPPNEQNKPEEKNPDEKKPEDNKPEEVELLPKGPDPVQQPPNGNNMSV